jgi:Arc/MetJ-type ribon-helix-helix transcriptional regulator
MTIHLPKDVESSIQAAVQLGRFSSVDEAMIHAAHLLLRELEHGQANSSANEAESPDPLLGSMRDYADEMDEIVAEAMRQRSEPWRVIDVE